MKPKNVKTNSFNRKYYKRVLIFLIAGFIGLLSHILYASSQAGLWEQGGQILDLVWGQTTLIDLYLGLTIFGVWVAFRERSAIVASIWIFLFFSSGFLSVALYLIIHILLLMRHQNPVYFFMGEHAPASEKMAYDD